MKLSCPELRLLSAGKSGRGLATSIAHSGAIRTPLQRSSSTASRRRTGKCSVGCDWLQKQGMREAWPAVSHFRSHRRVASLTFATNKGCHGFRGQGAMCPRTVRHWSRKLPLVASGDFRPFTSLASTLPSGVEARSNVPFAFVNVYGIRSSWASLYDELLRSLSSRSI